MSAADAPEIETRPATHLSVVRVTVPFDRIPEFYDRAYPRIFADPGPQPGGDPALNETLIGVQLVDG